jgi:hypothetical protein
MATPLEREVDPAGASYRLGSILRFAEMEKHPVLRDRAADENTGRRLKIEKTPTGRDSVPVRHAHFGRFGRDHREQTLLILAVVLSLGC